MWNIATKCVDGHWGLIRFMDEVLDDQYSWWLCGTIRFRGQGPAEFLVAYRGKCCFFCATLWLPGISCRSLWEGGSWTQWITWSGPTRFFLTVFPISHAGLVSWQGICLLAWCLDSYKVHFWMMPTGKEWQCVHTVKRHNHFKINRSVMNNWRGGIEEIWVSRTCNVISEPFPAVCRFNCGKQVHNLS